MSASVDVQLVRAVEVARRTYRQVFVHVGILGSQLCAMRVAVERQRVVMQLRIVTCAGRDRLRTLRNTRKGQGGTHGA